MCVESGSYSGQVKEAVHPAELLRRFEHPGGAPAQDHGAVPSTLHVAAWSRQISSIDSMALVERRVRASVGGTPRRLTVRVSDSPSPQVPRCAGVALGQAGGESLERGLGGQSVGVAVGGAHLLGHRRGQVLGQLGLHVADLVQLATRHHGMVEHRLHRRALAVAIDVRLRIFATLRARRRREQHENDGDDGGGAAREEPPSAR